jgi:hypothetical protein
MSQSFAPRAAVLERPLPSICSTPCKTEAIDRNELEKDGEGRFLFGNRCGHWLTAFNRSRYVDLISARG